MIRIVNPESFEFDGDDLRPLRDICRMAIQFSSNNQALAGMLPEHRKKALEMANEIVKMPIRFVEHEDQS